MITILRQRHIAYIALVLWLMAAWTGVHGHLCFDGQEPPFSVHMDVTGGHSLHHPDEQHLDSDVDFLQLLLAKLTKAELPLLLVAALFLLLLVRRNSAAEHFYSLFLPSPPSRLRPPLRAPPAFPA